MSLKFLDLQTLPQYRVDRSHVFPSDESLRWFVRQNKSELIERRALVAPTGRKMAQPAEFDLAVVEIGARQAARLGKSAK